MGVNAEVFALNTLNSNTRQWRKIGFLILWRGTPYNLNQLGYCGRSIKEHTADSVFLWNNMSECVNSEMLLLIICYYFQIKWCFLYLAIVLEPFATWTKQVFINLYSPSNTHTCTHARTTYNHQRAFGGTGLLGDTLLLATSGEHKTSSWQMETFFCF